jgi:hypothetical protein
MLAAEPDRSRPAKPGLLRVTPRACGPVLPAVDPVQPDKESWSSPCWRSPRWRRPSCGFGAGVSGPDAGAGVSGPEKGVERKEDHKRFIENLNHFEKLEDLIENKYYDCSTQNKDYYS